MPGKVAGITLKEKKLHKLHKQRYYDYVSRADLIGWWRNGTLVKRLKDIFFRYKPKYTGYADLYWHDAIASTTRRVSVLEQRLRERLVQGFRGGPGAQRFPSAAPVRRPTSTSPPPPTTTAWPAFDKKTWLTPPPVNRSDHRAYASYILNRNFTDESWEAIKEDGDHIRFEKFRRKPMDLDSSDLVSLTSFKFQSVPLFPYVIPVPNSSADIDTFENIELTSKEYEYYFNRTVSAGKKLNRNNMIKEKKQRLKQKILDEFNNTGCSFPSGPSEFSGEPANKVPIRGIPMYRVPK